MTASGKRNYNDRFPAAELEKSADVSVLKTAIADSR